MFNTFGMARQKIEPATVSASVALYCGLPPKELPGTSHLDCLNEDTYSLASHCVHNEDPDQTGLQGITITTGFNIY